MCFKFHIIWSLFVALTIIILIEYKHEFNIHVHVNKNKKISIAMHMLHSKVYKLSIKQSRKCLFAYLKSIYLACNWLLTDVLLYATNVP